MENKILDYFEIAYKWLQKLFSEAIIEIRKDSQNIDKTINTKIDILDKSIRAVKGAIENKEDITEIKINNPEDIKDDIVEKLKNLDDTLKEELPKINREVVIKNDLTSLLGLFKTNSDKKDIIQALRDIESKISKMEMPKMEMAVDYTLILNDIAILLEELNKKETKEIDFSIIEGRLADIHKLLEKETIPENLIEKDRIKVILSNEQLLKMGGGAAILQSDTGRATEETLLAVKTVLENLDVTINAGDIEIGAVEIKNSTDDTRATVGANGLYVDVKASVLPAGSATETTLADIAGNYAEAWADKTGDSTITYTGEAAIGSLTSSAVWRICEINTTTGRVKYAGSGAFTQIWDNRESLIFA